MKIRLQSLSILLALSTSVLTAAAQGTAFTYQGQLTTGSGQANGYYDLTYKLWNASSGGAQVGSTITITGTAISNGLFTATLDFGSVFNGSSYWIELGVRSNGVGSYQTLSPRQPVTPTPYAITAENVDGLVPASQLTGTIPSVNLSGTYGNGLTFNNAGNVFDGNGSGLTGVNASLLNGHNANFFWQLGGNTGTTPGVNYLGTTDLTPLEIDVQGQRAFRVEPDITYGFHIPNIIGGSPGNFVASGTVGNFIGGGGSYNESSTNYINAGNYNVIGGGWDNHITNFAYEATIAGGEYNAVGADHAAIGGGSYNAATGPESTIPGGTGNSALGYSSFAAGSGAQALNDNTFVWSDGAGPFASTAPNQFLIQAGFVGINRTNPIPFSGADYFDVRTPTAPGAYGGMYVETATAGKPFYGYAQSNSVYAWTYVDSTDANKWKLNVGGDRITVTTSGQVGIATTTPSATLEVNGNLRLDGLLNSGSQTGTTEPPSPPGLVIRRINSTTASSNSIVARTDKLTLIRDGSNGGWRVNYVASPGYVTIAATGVTSGGAVVGFYSRSTPCAVAGGVQVFTDAQAVHSVQISFGDPFDEAQMTQVNLTRSSGDYFWIGTVNSTFNQ